MTAVEVFNQQNGEVTKAWYAEMNRRGPHGQLAVALFRTQKRSTAAKSYRGGKYRSAAYDVKNWSLSEICRILTAYPELNATWGWKEDPDTPGFNWVLYVDLPREWYCACGWQGLECNLIHPAGCLPADYCPKCGLRWGLLFRGDRQVSFHSAVRLQGPDYAGDWDGKRASAERIVRYCDAVANSEPLREIAFSGPASKSELREQPPVVIVCDRGYKPSRLEQELKRGGGRLKL